MKKILCLFVLCCVAIGLFACVQPETPDTPDTPEVTVMSWEEYMAAELNSKVVIEAYVQAHQSWWDNKITIYAQDEDGGYYLYNIPCSEEDAAKLVPGTKIRVTGYKAEWSGEIEIVSDELDPAKIEILEGSYVATPVDVTDKLGTDELINYQNMLVEFKGMTVVSLEFKNGGGDDIYVNLTHNGVAYQFCVEVYLTGTSTELYQTVSALKEGDIIDVQGFAYWYNGINTHMTSVVVK